ncbi:DUF1269 domain-containing protein [Edaphobacter sp. HDX4]|uniref:DUF1269 domain-containing protein n=1 Tax=Edaphobacter sp. HDX4 TaxID=2794064 RepID=UPI002FE604C8
MDRMLVVVFDSENKAYEGKKALQELANEGSIGLYAQAVLAKKSDGTATVKQGEDAGPIGTLAGTSFGALIGLLGGPAGMLAGAAVGMSAGAVGDFANLGIGEDFIDDVTKVLKPNKVALIAEIDEEWIAPVDTRMEAIGGTVFRRALAEVQDKVWEENVNAMKADLAQMKAEQAQGRADQKARIQEKVSQLDAKIQNQMQKIKGLREAATVQAQAKADVLKAKAAAVRTRTS